MGGEKSRRESNERGWRRRKNTRQGEERGRGGDIRRRGETDREW